MSTELNLVDRLERLEHENSRMAGLLQRERCRFRVQIVLAGFALLAAVFFAPGSRRAFAQSGSGVLQRLDALEAKVTAEIAARTQADTDTLASAKAYTDGKFAVAQSGLTTEIAARTQGDVDTLASANGYTDSKVAGAQSGLTTEIARAQGAEATLSSRSQALETLTAPLSLNGTDLTIHGVNVHIVNGTDNTYNNNGLGNLIIGYNETRIALGIPAVIEGVNIPLDSRFGSHNLIMGSGQNYTGVGGIAAGWTNSIDGIYSSVLGGGFNYSKGFNSVVSGGLLNNATVQWTSVSGGGHNTASNDRSSVSGGEFNTANGGASSVSGGRENSASGPSTSVSGGRQNTASGFAAAIAGGHLGTASGEVSSVVGGIYNRASALRATVSGGYNNWASYESSSVSGGANNQSNGPSTSVSGGELNLSDGFVSTISGGKGIHMSDAHGWAGGSFAPNIFRSP